MFKLLTAFTIALLLFSNSRAVCGYTPPLETIIVRSEQAALSTTSLSVVDRQDLSTLLPTHISEALARSAGTWINRGNGQEQLTAIRSPVLTGAGSCGAFYMAEDGIPIRATGFCNVNQLFDANTEQAERIEVVRGPGIALHGANTVHGMINVVSQAPSAISDNQLSIEGGPHHYRRLQYSGSHRQGQHAYRLSINGSRDGGYKEESGYDQQKLTLRHDYHNDALQITSVIAANNLNQETAGFIAGNEAYKDESRKTENPNPEAFRDSRSIRFYSRMQQLINNDTRLTFTPYLRHTDMDFLLHFLPGTPREKNGHSSIGLQAAIERRLSGPWTIRNGVDLEYTDAYLKQYQATGFSSFPAGRQYDYEVSAQLAAMFVNTQYQAADSTRVFTGLRYEYLKYDYDNRMISGDTAEDGSPCINSLSSLIGCRYSRPEDRDDLFNNGSFSVGIQHQLNRSSQLIGNISHGFRAPQATELYRLQNGQLLTAIDSEQIDSIEWGIRVDTEALNYALTAYWMEKDHVIFQSADRLNLDNGQTRHYGLEYELLWRINTQWQLQIAGALAKHQYTKNVSAPGFNQQIDVDGNDVDTAPRHLGSMQLSWAINADSRAELEWIHIGRYYTDINNAHQYDGHDLLNLRMRQRLTASTELGIRITNLMDTDYAERADYSGFNNTDRYFVGEPRSVYIDISITF